MNFHKIVVTVCGIIAFHTVCSGGSCVLNDGRNVRSAAGLVFPSSAPVTQTVVTEPTLPVAWSAVCKLGVASVAEGYDGKYVMTIGNGLITCFDNSTGAMQWERRPYFFDDQQNRFEVDPQMTMLKNHPWFLLSGTIRDSTSSAISRGVISIRSYPTGDLVRNVFLHYDSTNDLTTGAMGIAGALVSDDERFLVSANISGFMTVWNLANGEIYWEIPPTSGTTIPLCFTRDSTRLLVVTYPTTDITSSSTRTISCIDVESKSTIWSKEVKHDPFRFVGVMTGDGKHIRYGNTSNIVIESFPSFETVLNKADYNTAYWFADDNATHVVACARDKDYTPRGVMIYNLLDSSEVKIDTANATVFAATVPGSMYYAVFDEPLNQLRLMKIGFNWAMDVAEQAELLQMPTFGPNPCTSTGLLRYNVPNESRVTVSIYSMDGRLENVVLPETLQTGVQQVSLQCGTLSTGVHVLLLRINDHSTTILLSVLE